MLIPNQALLPSQLRMWLMWKALNFENLIILICISLPSSQTERLFTFIDPCVFVFCVLSFLAICGKSQC